MKSTPDAPTPPDPFVGANAQAQFNSINQVTPYGSLSFSGGANPQQAAEIGRLQTVLSDPGINEATRQIATQQLQDAMRGVDMQRTATLNLSPELQALFGQQQQLSSNTLADALRRQGQLPQDSLQYNPQDFSAASQQAQDATFQRARGMLDPMFAEREQRLDQSLADRGLPVGSEIYGDEKGVEGRSRNEAYLSAALDSIMAGNQRQNELFGQNLQDFNAQGAARGNQFNEMASLLGMQQVNPQQTQLGGFAMPGGVDFLGAQQAQFAGQNANYNAAMNQQNSMFGGLAGLGGATLGGWLSSDRRLKRDVSVIGRIKGLTLYLYRYLWDDAFNIGFMADEVRKAKPEAVFERGGYLMVNYAEALA